MKAIKRIVNLLLMELNYQYLRLNAIIWREDFQGDSSLYRKRVEKMIEEAQESGRRFIYTGSVVDEVKLSLRERWQAWSEDGVTLTTPLDEIRSKTAQRLNELWERLQDDSPPESK